MKEKFFRYGNSWVGFNDDKFWKSRLQREIDEIWKAKTPEEMKNEITDAINVLAMINSNVNNMSWLFQDETKMERKTFPGAIKK